MRFLVLVVACCCMPTADVGTASSLPVVISSMDPVLLNETVVSFVPGYVPSEPSSTTYIELCTALKDGCRKVEPLREALGVVHWVLPADMPDLDEYTYRICPTPDCTDVEYTRLNAAQLYWGQCVGTIAPSPVQHSAAVAGGNGMSINEMDPSSSQLTNGLDCTAGRSVLRLFGLGLAYENGPGGGKCAPYRPYTLHRDRVDNARPAAVATMLRLTPVAFERPVAVAGAPSAAAATIAAAAQSCYDASFILPSTLTAGLYTLEVKSNLPNATWMAATDPDQRTLQIAASTATPPLATQETMFGSAAIHHSNEPHTDDLAPPCHAKINQVYPVNSRETLLSAIAAAGKSVVGGGIIKLAAGVILMRATDTLVLPDCTAIEGAGMSKSILRWPTTTCGGKGTSLIEPSSATGSNGIVTLADFAVEGVGYKGCAALVGATKSNGLTLLRMNITLFEQTLTQHVYSSTVSLNSCTNFLIEGCVFMHGGNNSAGDAHSGVNSPIISIVASSNGVVRDNLWQIGLSGWNIDKSWAIVQESNIYTGYMNNDPARPMPSFDGSFWFSSYGQGPFPGAGRFFYANTTQNERPHSKPQVGGGESFTLDGGNSGGYFGPLASSPSALQPVRASVQHPAAAAAGQSITVAGDVCWNLEGGYVRPTNCVTNVNAWAHGRTGHAVVVLSGPGAGQYRRVVGVKGPRNRTIVVDRPFNPMPTGASQVQVGPFRGQIMLVGNNFQKGGGVQLYAACYDCIVAQNTFEQFAFSNWGRAPHGAGFQPNLNNQMSDNMVGVGQDVGRQAMVVRGCSSSCSGAFGRSCYRDGVDGRHEACPQNGTANSGRDCAPYNSQPYQGAINLQLAYRRNTMSNINFLNGKDARTAGVPSSWNGGTGRIPLVDGGLVEHTMWSTANGSAMLNFSFVDNMVLRD